MAFAVIVHGGDRTTKDIDFLIDASPENVARVKSALRILPDNAASQLEDGDVEKYKVVRVADEVVVDLLAGACGVSYEEATNSHPHEADGPPFRPHGDCEYLESRIAEENRESRK